MMVAIASCDRFYNMEATLKLFSLAARVPTIFIILANDSSMTDDKLYTSLSANTIMAKLTNHV